MKNAYWKILLLLILVPCAAVGWINFQRDPLHYYSLPPGSDWFFKNQRYQLPGLIRNLDYDSIVLGTSYTENFMPSLVEAALGGKVLKASISGSGIREQHEALKLALANRDGLLKRVIWGLDYDSITTGDMYNINIGHFPAEFYQPSPVTVLQYLVNADTLRMSLDRNIEDGHPDLETLNTWYDQYEFSAERAFTALAFIDRRWDDRLRQVWADFVPDWARLETYAQRYIEQPIRNHPEVHFDLLLLPYSSLQYFSDFDLRPERFHDRLRFRSYVIDRLALLPNVSVHDFQADSAIVTDLDRYKDTSHFGLKTTLQVLEAVENGSHLRRGGEAAAANRELVALLGGEQQRYCGARPSIPAMPENLCGVQFSLPAPVDRSGSMGGKDRLK